MRFLAAAGLVVVAAAVAVAMLARGSSAGPLFEPPVLGGQPAGAVVLSQEDGALAVVLAAKPVARRTLLVATVLAPDGEAASGLHVRFRTRGVEAAADRGASGTYAAALPVSRPGRVVWVSLGRADRVAFQLPALWPPRSARRELVEATRAYRSLRTLVIHERLASAPGDVLRSVYVAQAPDRLSITSANGNRSIVIGGRRWDRHPGSAWRRSEQEPALDPLAPFWHGLVEDPTLLGREVAHGRRLLRLSFAAPQIPAFFELTIDEADHRPLDLEMIAAAHFMHHVYSGFGRPVRIVPPS
jgi:hypothetical protein